MDHLILFLKIENYFIIAEHMDVSKHYIGVNLMVCFKVYKDMMMRYERTEQFLPLCCRINKLSHEDKESAILPLCYRINKLSDEDI